MTLSMVDFTGRDMHDFFSGRFYLEVHTCHCQ
jgi:hypothetical protein